MGGAAASAALAAAGDEAFLSGGLKYTGKGLPPMGLPFSSMLSYGSQQMKVLALGFSKKAGVTKQYAAQYPPDASKFTS